MRNKTAMDTVSKHHFNKKKVKNLLPLVEIYKQKIENFSILQEMERSRESNPSPSPIEALKRGGGSIMEAPIHTRVHM